MTHSRVRTFVAICSVAALGLPPVAHGHGAHVHGEAQAAIVIEGRSVSLSLTSAMYNITGFERAPKNDAEAQVLSDAIATLKRATDIIVLDPDAGCTEVSITHNLPESPGADSDTSDGRNPYRDLEAAYTFDCAAPDRLAVVSFPLFEQFGNLEKLDIVVLKGDAQVADTLEPDRNTLVIG